MLDFHQEILDSNGYDNGDVAIHTSKHDGIMRIYLHGRKHDDIELTLAGWTALKQLIDKKILELILQ